MNEYRKTYEVLPTVVRCYPPPLCGCHSLCYVHKLRQPLRFCRSPHTSRRLSSHEVQRGASSGFSVLVHCPMTLQELWPAATLSPPMAARISLSIFFRIRADCIMDHSCELQFCMSFFLIIPIEPLLVLKSLRICISKGILEQLEL